MRDYALFFSLLNLPCLRYFFAQDTPDTAFHGCMDKTPKQLTVPLDPHIVVNRIATLCSETDDWIPFITVSHDGQYIWILLLPNDCLILWFSFLLNNFLFLFFLFIYVSNLFHIFILFLIFFLIFFLDFVILALLLVEYSVSSVVFLLNVILIDVDAIIAL